MRGVKKWHEIKEGRGKGRPSLYILRMGGSVGAEKQSEGGWANERESRLPKAASAEFGGSPAIRTFTEEQIMTLSYQMFMGSESWITVIGSDIIE